MNQNFYAVIMAGGIGSRFWPLSTRHMPKQFLDVLNTGKSLIQQTYNRFAKICPKENIYVVTNEQYVALVMEHLPEMSPSQILGEPIGKNTAPCINYAAEKIASINSDAVMVVAPSDHVIENEDEFVSKVLKSLAFAQEKPFLISIGIEPTRPDTGYGYIQYKEEDALSGFKKVKTFTEKPNAALAEQFLDSGEFLWNAGIFIWGAQTIIDAFAKYLPEVGNMFSQMRASFNTVNEKEEIRKCYELCTNISIDYAIMEKADNVYVIPSSIGWSDVGTWNALYDIRTKDAHQNVITASNAFLRNCHGSIVHVDGKKLVAINDLDNIIVVDSGKVLLIANRNSEQSIKQLVTELKLSKGDSFI